ncbi:MAG: glutamyl-tRNA reductase [Actinomycetales bacterium]|nr:glutamyl-tRNA reductase [Actinomycetales bacterium]
MVLVLVGASHHDVSFEELDRLAAAESGLVQRLVQSSEDISGAVVLSTCNRFEVYLDLQRFHDAVDHTTETIAAQAGVDRDFVVDAMRVVVGTSVSQHLFSVASGLESMVVGEDEIAGQVRHALADAQSAGTTTPTLERLLQRALATSKQVSSNTGLGAAGRSIVSVGLDVVEERHGPVAGTRALVLGTGSYARVVIATLQRRGCTDISVFSASGRAAQFAQSHDVHPVEVNDLADALASVDLVAACSGAPHHLIDLPLMAASGAAADRVLPMLDLALTPDVSPEVRALPNVDVVDLQVIHDIAPREHSSAILEAQEIVLSSVREFEDNETGRSADHAIVAMRAHVMGIIGEEIERIRRRVDPDTAEEVARSLNRVSNAILHTPSVRAQELARTGDFADYSKAVHTLFGIDVSAPRD